MSNSQIYKILLIGPQGSGKGTQAQILAEKFGIPVFSTGNMLRQRIQTKDKIGQDLAAIMNRGDLPSDAAVNEIVVEKIKSEGKGGYILDGYPRRMSQADFLDKIEQLTHVLEIYISDKEAIRRLSGRRTCEQCQAVYHLDYNPPKQAGRCDQCRGKLIIRADETEPALKIRLTTYHKVTEPMIEFYKYKGVWQRINGEQPIPMVTEEILEKLENGN